MTIGKKGVALLLLSLALVGCQNETAQVPTVSSDNSAQGQPYGCDATGASDSCDGEETTAAEEAFEAISMDDAIEFFQQKKSGILYFGYPTCPWCEDVVPLLKEEAEKQGVTVYYIQTRDEDKNRIYTDEQKEEIQPYIESYMSDNEEGELTLYVPLVISVKDGVAVYGHVGTVDGHNAKEREMTEEETDQLRSVLDELLETQE